MPGHPNRLILFLIQKVGSGGMKSQIDPVQTMKEHWKSLTTINDQLETLKEMLGRFESE